MTLCREQHLPCFQKFAKVTETMLAWRTVIINLSFSSHCFIFAKAAARLAVWRPSHFSFVSLLRISGHNALLSCSHPYSFLSRGILVCTLCNSCECPRQKAKGNGSKGQPLQMHSQLTTFIAIATASDGLDSHILFCH